MWSQDFDIAINKPKNKFQSDKKKLRFDLSKQKNSDGSVHVFANTQGRQAVWNPKHFWIYLLIGRLLPFFLSWYKCDSQIQLVVAPTHTQRSLSQSNAFTKARYVKVNIWHQNGVWHLDRNISHPIKVNCEITPIEARHLSSPHMTLEKLRLQSCDL